MKNAFLKLSQGRREEILDAAIAAFAEKGYAGAGIADVCARAGISNGALYKYFRDKDDLFSAVAGRGAALIEEVFAGIDPESAWRGYFSAVLDRIDGLDEQGRRAVALYLELGSPSMNRFAAELAAPLEDSGGRHIRAWAEAARARGELREDLDPAAAAFAADSLVVLYGFAAVSDYHRARIAAFAGGGAGGAAGIRDFTMAAIGAVLGA